MSIHADNPLPGWYKHREGKGGRWVAAYIIRRPGGELACRVGSRMVDPYQVWTYLADNQVTKEAAKHWFEHGRWPDEPEAVPRSNLPDDPLEALQVQIEAKTEQYDRLLKDHPVITSLEVCSFYRNLQTELLAFKKQADALHDVEKAPHLEAGRRVDKKFEFRKTLDDMARTLRTRFGAFMAQEEERQTRQAQLKHEAELARIQAENDKKMRDDPVAALTDPEPRLPFGPEPVKVQVGGLFAPKAGLKDAWVAVVDDYAKAAKYFKDHPDLQEVVRRLAQHVVKDAKGNIKVPGVTIEHRRVAA